MDVFSLISKTNAYNVFQKDNENATLSHAYLIVCSDGDMLENYLKIFVKTMLCKSTPYCDACRTCRLVDKKSYVDAKFYPTDGKIKVADIDDLVTKTYVKPLENDKKVFVLVNANEMNAQAQNKLLKTLEEPPKNTHIILGATSVFSLLPTVLSRVKRLDIPPFSEEQLTEFMLKEYNDKSRVSSAVALSLGKLSQAIKRYEEGYNGEVEELCYSILLGMKSSKDAYKFTDKITKDNVKDVISALQRILRDVLLVKSGKTLCVDNQNVNKTNEVASAMNYGALIYMSEKLTQIEKTMQFNANINAVIDGILFGILEGKFKWQKL